MYWWHLSFSFHSSLEEALLWKCGDLGIQGVAVKYCPHKPDFPTLLVWIPDKEWSNFDRDQLLNLMGYFGENVQDSVYNLDFEMNRSNVYENPSEREKFFADAYRDEKQQAALQEELAEFTREGVGTYNTMSKSLKERYNNLRGFLEKNVDNRFLDQEEKDTIKDQLNILKTLR